MRPSEASGLTAESDTNRIQEIVNHYLERLDLPDRVRVSVVPINPLLVSVESVDEDGGGFLLSLQGDFIAQLSDEELGAAIAHELGHVWIFTHHPFLQTEALANEIAMRLVTKDSLVLVYDRVWKRVGSKGDLARFVED
ncbi:MAG TPA: hypothetical protein VIY56_17435 [Vicinamibacterales bacterium]